MRPQAAVLVERDKISLPGCDEMIYDLGRMVWRTREGWVRRIGAVSVEQ